MLVFIPKGWVPNQQDVEDDTCPGEETGSLGENSLLEAGAHSLGTGQTQAEKQKLGKYEDLLTV